MSGVPVERDAYALDSRRMSAAMLARASSLSCRPTREVIRHPGYSSHHKYNIVSIVYHLCSC